MIVGIGEEVGKKVAVARMIGFSMWPYIAGTKKPAEAGFFI